MKINLRISLFIALWSLLISHISFFTYTILMGLLFLKSLPPSRALLQPLIIIFIIGIFICILKMNCIKNGLDVRLTDYLLLIGVLMLVPAVIGIIMFIQNYITLHEIFTESPMNNITIPLSRIAWNLLISGGIIILSRR